MSVRSINGLQAHRDARGGRWRRRQPARAAGVSPGPGRAARRRSFNDTVTVRVHGRDRSTRETRTVAFTTAATASSMSLPVADSVNGLDSDRTTAPTVNITYNEVVTLLNLRQKGPGSQGRRARMAPARDQTDIEIRPPHAHGRRRRPRQQHGLGDRRPRRRRPDLHGDPIAKQDMLKKIKVGDVVIGLTTPLMVTAITPAQ